MMKFEMFIAVPGIHLRLIS